MLLEPLHHARSKTAGTEETLEAHEQHVTACVSQRFLFAKSHFDGITDSAMLGFNHLGQPTYGGRLPRLHNLATKDGAIVALLANAQFMPSVITKNPDLARVNLTNLTVSHRLPLVHGNEFLADYLKRDRTSSHRLDDT